MLEVYLHDCADALRFQLKGELRRPWAADLEQSWRTAESIRKQRPVVVDLLAVSVVDGEGERVLRLLCERGARLITGSPDTDRVARRISGRDPEPLDSAARGWRRLACWLARCCRALGLGPGCASGRRTAW